MGHLRTTFQHLRRSPYQALTAIGIMTLTNFVASLFFLVAIGSQGILSHFESTPQITVFFSDEKDETSIVTLEDRLQKTGRVAGLKFVSKEEALKIYQEQNKDDPLLLEMVTADILPASLEIAATAPQYLGELAEVVQNEPLVEDVMYQKDVVEALISWTSGIRLAGSLLIVFLMIVSLSIILTVIGMKIALRKEEIEILKLVGAGSWFIRAPFLLEGIFYGIVGAICSWGGVYLLLLYLTPFLKSFLTGIPPLELGSIFNLLNLTGLGIFIWPPSFPFMLFLLLGMVLLASLVGGLGSFLALVRYL